MALVFPAFKKRPDVFPNVLMVLTVSSNEFLSPFSVISVSSAYCEILYSVSQEPSLTFVPKSMTDTWWLVVPFYGPRGNPNIILHCSGYKESFRKRLEMFSVFSLLGRAKKSTGWLHPIVCKFLHSNTQHIT